ncbi:MULTISPECIES: MFS transporter [Bacillaceae]|uniref:MFS transporter n=1 Tax=Evansella alkalicola TaxID=745819 RepID=A0ABS6JVV5_9BACI|nr:MFS transporter [Litchfieldia alkalitelluris]MBU9721377.1 MFS transporter [Bacillus alkalicola]
MNPQDNFRNATIENSSIWKNITFVKLFASYGISTFGRFFDMMAVILLFSYVWQVEPWVIALVPVVYAFPHALFSQIAGIYVDRYNKVKIMLCADLLTAIFTLMLFFVGTPWFALIVLLLRSTCTIVHFPAQQAIIQKIVAPDLIMKAVTLNGTVNQLSKIIGPFLGASLAAAFSPKISFLVYVSALLISVVLLMTVRHVDDSTVSLEEEGENTSDSIWKTWREGWQLLFQKKILLSSFLFTLLAFTAIQLVDVQYAVLFREVYPSQPSILGWAMSSTGIGAVLIIFFLNKMKEVKSYGWYLGGSVLFIGIGFTLNGMMATGAPVVWPISASLLVGVGVGIFSVIHSYILQKESPEGKVGQMSGMYNSLSGFILLSAPILGGALVQWVNVFTVFKLIGLVVVAIGCIGILFQKKLWSTKNTVESKGRETPSKAVEVG